MECPGCGSVVPAESQECPECGLNLSAAEEVEFVQSPRGIGPYPALTRLTPAVRRPDDHHATGPLTSGSAAPVGAIGGLIASVGGFLLSLDRLRRFNSPLGQLATELNTRLAHQKLAWQILMAAAVIVGIVSIAVMIGHYSRSGETAAPRGEKVLLVCPSCRSRNPDGQRFCGNCGAQLS